VPYKYVNVEEKSVDMSKIEGVNEIKRVVKKYSINPLNFLEVHNVFTENSFIQFSKLKLIH
jgi:hypothetical protein